jgi:hypothetical protein
LDKQSPVFDPKPDPSAPQPDGRVANVLRFRNDEAEPSGRAESRQFANASRGASDPRPRNLGLPQAPALRDSENERRRLEDEDRDAPTATCGRRAQQGLVERYSLAGLIDV